MMLFGETETRHNRFASFLLSPEVETSKKEWKRKHRNPRDEEAVSGLVKKAVVTRIWYCMVPT